MLGWLQTKIELTVPCTMLMTLVLGGRLYAQAYSCPATIDLSIFDHPTQNKISYELHIPKRGFLPPSESGTTCGPPLRQNLDAFEIRIVDLRTGKFDTNRMKLAVDSLVSLVGNSSKVALKKVTDTTAEGWQDVPGSVCRAHQYKRSLVLPVPYYENVE
jgi:hypothetical protein